MTPTPVLSRALAYGAILTVAIAAVGGLLGYLAAGTEGLLSAIIGAGITAVFMGFTALSIVIAQRATRGEPSLTLFFGIILGAWMLKFVVFIVLVVIVRGQPFLEPLVFFFSVLAAVIGSLVVDVLAFLRSRVPYVDVELPGDDSRSAS
jgi:uncharacterized membrane protein (DUF4010 family)